MKKVLLEGNCLEQLKYLPENSIDAVVTDPPYGLSFMGKKWDYDVPSIEIWREVLRVLKPGGHLLSFGGTRTYHRMVVNIEDAGFEIRDQLQWLYGSGFPKSHDISKAIDKQAGADREVLGASPFANKGRSKTHNAMSGEMTDSSNEKITAPATPEAIKYQGWGTALKPANEPICLARKPLESKLTIAQNVVKYGTGGLNIDATRVGTEVRRNGPASTKEVQTMGRPGQSGSGWTEGFEGTTVTGRFPANIILDEEAAAALDVQSGQLGLSKGASRGGNRSQNFGMGAQDIPLGYGDSGGASRFFYCAKASKSERNAGLEGMPTQILATSTGQTRPNKPARLGADPHSVQEPVQNFHPTVKPVKLMEYLVKLITPVDGIVLDPFMGSGTTGVACKNLDVDFIGIEMSPEYMAIASKRIGE